MDGDYWCYHLNIPETLFKGNIFLFSLRLRQLKIAPAETLINEILL